MLVSLQIFDHHSELAKSKVVPVVGELTAENFAFEDSVLQDLRQNVQIIFHSAATIKFNTALKSAIEINVVGTQRTLELAKSLHHLAAYVYLSTAFCNSNYRGLIKEKVYGSRYKPAEMIEKAARNEFPLSASDPATKDIIGRHPNTYTFTKQLAETLIHDEMKNLPVGIVRPSVGEYALDILCTVQVIFGTNALCPLPILLQCMEPTIGQCKDGLAVRILVIWDFWPAISRECFEPLLGVRTLSWT